MLSGNRVIIGQYQPGQGLLHRLDPRTKIVLVFLVMIAVLGRTSLPFYAFLVILLLGALGSARLDRRAVISGLKPIIWFVVFTALFHIIFSGHDDPAKILKIGSFAVSEKAAEMALAFSSRIVIFVLATLVLSLTTNPLAISEAVVSLIKPLRLVKIPVHDLGMILFIALRFVPVLAEEMESIRKAQLIRGIDFRGSPVQRIKKSMALILPVFFCALRRADDLSVAIETRGYRSGQPRSSLHPLKLVGIDYIFIITGTVIAAAVLLEGRLFG